MKKIFMAMGLTMLVAVPAIAETGFGNEIAKAGRWVVYADVDPMSDKAQCTALFDDRADVQMTPNMFAISLRGRGGVEGYRLRLDDDPPSDIILPSEGEKAIGAMVIEGDALVDLMQAQRVRVQVLTVLGSLIDEDIDLSTAGEISSAFTEAGCT